jgi:hypothetical protein
MSDPKNPFGDFEADFKDVKAAPPGSFPGRLPEGTYKFVLTSKDLKDDGNLVDFEVFVAKNTGSKGFKLFCEVIEPKTMKNPNTGEDQKTEGEVLDHVFWVTKKNLPYMCRDLSTIAEREIQGVDVGSGAICKMTWAGRTFEGVVGDEKDLSGVVRSKIKYINPWAPKAEEGANKHGAASSSKDETKKVEKTDTAKKPDPKTATQGAGKGKVDF